MGGIKGHGDTNELSTMMELEKSRLSAILIVPCKNHQSMLKLIGKKVINVVYTNSCMTGMSLDSLNRILKYG